MASTNQMIGIRREDKSQWEARVPLVPADVLALRQQHDIPFAVQTSPIRVFKDADYADAGATIVEDFAGCPIIMGVKEIPVSCFEPDKTYVFFSHTIKAQAANMPALRRMVELGCTLIDYERIVDAQGRRLVFFGRYAGLAGMIDTLWALGQRLDHEGIANPFSTVRPAHRYQNLDHFSREIAAVAEVIAARGIPEPLRPLVCGFAGYGQVSQGAQAIFDQLPAEEITPAELPALAPVADRCFKVVFREEHLVERIDSSAPFALQEYYQQPDRYRASFFPYAEHLSLLVNCIYWEPKYPRLLTRAQLQQLYGSGQPRLRVVGDITCDIDGSVACTTRATDPSEPVYVYDPATGQTTDGVVGSGPVVLAVDFLPCELPEDASLHFSAALRPFVPALAGADFSGDLAETGLPPELRAATIVYKGQLTETYRYLEPEIR